MSNCHATVFGQSSSPQFSVILLGPMEGPECDDVGVFLRNCGKYFLYLFFRISRPSKLSWTKCSSTFPKVAKRKALSMYLLVSNSCYLCFFVTGEGESLCLQPQSDGTSFVSWVTLLNGHYRMSTNAKDRVTWLVLATYEEGKSSGSSNERQWSPVLPIILRVYWLIAYQWLTVTGKGDM